MRHAISFFVGLSLLTTTSVFSQSVIYVDANASGKNDGTSWTDAYTVLEDGFTNSQLEDSIWVASGTYKPKDGKSSSNFSLPNGRLIFGGFAGTETEFSQRDVQKNRTYLDADVGTVGQTTDNCKMVVSCYKLNVETTIDGFFIQNGYSYTVGSTGITSGGGAFRILDSKVTIRNCTVRYNYAYVRGGAIYSQDASSIIIDNCDFYGNSTGTNTQSLGGAIYMSSGSLKIYGSHFHENESRKGGAIATYSPVLLIDRTIFSGNESTNSYGGAIYIGDECNSNIYNSLFVGNYAETTGSAIYMNSVYNGDYHYYVNNTFTNNYSKSASGYTVYANENRTNVRNCIIYGNRDKAPLNAFSTVIEPVVKNCVLEGGYAKGTDVTSNDPSFVKPGTTADAPFTYDATKHDYSIDKNSSAINAGDSLLTNLKNYGLDLLLNDRVQGGQIDAGAFESPYESYKVSINVEDTSVANVSGAGNYSKDAKVTIAYVLKDDCMHFKHWTESDTLYTTDSSFSINANRNFSFKPIFERNRYDVIVKTNPPEAAITTGSGNYPCHPDSAYTFNTTPKKCYNFINWTINGNEFDTELSFNATIGSDVELVANYSRTFYQVTITPNPFPGGTSSGSGYFACDSTITVKATPRSGYTFDSWKLGSTVISRDANFTFKIIQPMGLTAEFKKVVGIENVNQHTVTLYPNPGSGNFTLNTGNVSPTQVVITNHLGQEVANVPLEKNQTQITSSHLTTEESGLYFITLFFDDGETTLRYMNCH